MGAVYTKGFEVNGGKTSEELKASESVAEAAKPESPRVKILDISIHEAATTDCSASVGQTYLTTTRNLNKKPVRL